MSPQQKTKQRPVEEDVEEADDELEELSEDEGTDEEPATKSSKAPEVEFGVADLAKHLSKKLKRDFTTRELRTLIRKMAREDKPRVNREVVAGNRSRYDWHGGLENKEVKRIIAAVEAGEIEQGKKEALDRLKAQKAKKQAAAKKAAESASDDEVDDED